MKFAYTPNAKPNGLVQALSRVRTTSSVPITAPASTAETTLLLLPIEANSLSINGIARLMMEWSCNNNANTKIIRVYAGLTGTTADTLASQQTCTTNTFAAITLYFGNRSSFVTQIVTQIIAGSLNSSIANTVTNFDTQNNMVFLTVTGQKAVAGDSLQIETASLEFLN